MKYLYDMEFNIRKGATLPFIEVDLTKNGVNEYNYANANLSGAIIYFYMKNVETGVYKIAKGTSTFDSTTNSIYYQFTKKNTSEVNRYEGEFKIQTQEGIVDLPLSDKIYINVLDSISNSDFCCK
jgi:hypothetical protein